MSFLPFYQIKICLNQLVHFTDIILQLYEAIIADNGSSSCASSESDIDEEDEGDDTSSSLSATDTSGEEDAADDSMQEPRTIKASHIQHVIKWFMYFLLMWKNLKVISDKAIQKLLAFLSTFWSLCADMNNFMK